MIKSLHDLPALRQRLPLAGHDQGAGYQWLAQTGQDRLSYSMIRNSDSDCASLRVQHASRHISGGRHDEGVLPRGGGLERSKNDIVEVDESAKLIEVRANQGEVMAAIELSNVSNPVQPLLIVKLAAERVAGICRVGDQPISTNKLD